MMVNVGMIILVMMVVNMMVVMIVVMVVMVTGDNDDNYGDNDSIGSYGTKILILPSIGVHFGQTLQPGVRETSSIEISPV